MISTKLTKQVCDLKKFHFMDIGTFSERTKFSGRCLFSVVQFLTLCPRGSAKPSHTLFGRKVINFFCSFQACDFGSAVTLPQVMTTIETVKTWEDGTVE